MVNHDLIARCGNREAARERSPAVPGAGKRLSGEAFTDLLPPSFTMPPTPEWDLEVFVMVIALAAAAVGSLAGVLVLSLAPAWRSPLSSRLRGRSVGFETQA